MKQSILTDHRGKPSSGRVAALSTTATACALCLAPLWGGPPPDLIMVAMLLGIPGAYSVYQKINAPGEQVPKDG